MKKHCLALFMCMLCLLFYGQNNTDKLPAAEDYKKIREAKKDSLDNLISTYTKLLATNPKDDKTLFMRGKAKFELFDYPAYTHNYDDLNGALSDFTRVIELKSAYTDTAYFMKANIKTETLGSFNGAGGCFDDLVLDELTKAIKINPTFSNAWLFMGICYIDDNHDYPKAIEMFSKAIETNPKNAMAYYYRGVCKSKLPQKDMEGACADWNKEIELGGEGAKIDLIENCEFTPKTAQDYYDVLLYKSIKLNKKTRLEYSNKGLELDPKFAALYSMRGHAKNNLGDKNGACEDWHKAVELGYTTDEYTIIKYCDFTPVTAKDFYNRAVFKSKDDYKAKIADCSKAIELDTAYALAYFVRGTAKEHLGDTAAACADWQKAYNLGAKGNVFTFIYRYCTYAPKSAEDFWYRAIYKKGEKDYKPAIEDCSKAIELNPNYADAYFTRAGVKESLGDKDGACLDYKKAEQLGNKYAAILINRNCSK